MSNFNIPNPFLHSPSAEPKRHGWILEGQPGLSVVDLGGRGLLVVKQLEKV